MFLFFFYLLYFVCKITAKVLIIQIITLIIYTLLYNIRFEIPYLWYVKYDILLKDVGVEGHEKIRQGKVLIIGAGGLGAPVALYLAAAGVGTIGISPS